MALNRRDLKVISITQLILCLVFLILGLVDGLAVRFVYSSLTFTPCWLATLVFNAGFMGLVLSSMYRPSLTLMNFLQSVSVTCATISAITVYHYMFAWSKLIALNSEGYFPSNTNRYFLGKDEDTKFTGKQKSMVAVSFLIIICSITEIILAIAAIRSSNIDVQGPQESQVLPTGIMGFILAIRSRQEPSVVLPIGIMGLVLAVNGSRPSSALMSGLRSVSIACAALSVLTTFTYAMALNSILFIKYMEAKTEYQESPWFADKGAKIEFRKEEKTMVAVHVFIIICSILEIILAIASVRTAKAMAKEPQDTQQESAAYRVVAEEDVPLLFSSSDQEAA
ncbi:unnamed protein product [Pocillopora meandrina]|uniref:Uncharacterized protein n=1 Tax=Pocillopora meandrina TaxID=46732 RepID=A0AAU9XCN9_9CNID|nr:unnamed protein product [Pocillopora meandrina]